MEFFGLEEFKLQIPKCQWDNSTPFERNLGQCDSVVVVFFA